MTKPMIADGSAVSSALAEVQVQLLSTVKDNPPTVRIRIKIELRKTQLILMLSIVSRMEQTRTVSVVSKPGHFYAISCWLRGIPKPSP